MTATARFAVTHSRSVHHAKGFPAVPVGEECQIIRENTTVIKLMDAYIPGVTFHSHLNISSFHMALCRAEEQEVGVDFMSFFIELSAHPLELRWSLKR